MNQTGELITVPRETLELATFYIGTAMCGIDIIRVQEINRLMEMTEVPQAPNYVRGILNLRGHIVTVIDLAEKLGLSAPKITDQTRNLIVKYKGEWVGLLVEKIGDVMPVDTQKIEAPPSNIGDVRRNFFTGVYKTHRCLIGVLDVDAVLDEDETNKKASI